MDPGAQLKSFRKAAGLTQGQLAQRAGTTQAQVGRLEKGQRRLTDDWVMRLAPALGRNIDDFFTSESGDGGEGQAPRDLFPAPLLQRIAMAVERLAPDLTPDLTGAGQAAAPQGEALVWRPEERRLQAVKVVNRVDIGLLKGIDGQRHTLLANTRRFAEELPANNALLWGARGMGKSSLVKAVHAKVNGDGGAPLTLVEIHREDIPTLPRLLDILRRSEGRYLLFCDDLSFDGHDASYKSLKAVLEGGIEGRPANVLFYATSNRRHLMPREMIENERSSAINPGEAVDEKVSLSDRFGLWLGFHACAQDTYLEIVQAYARHYRLDVAKDRLRTEAMQWSLDRGARSGRVAWQFIQDLAGRLGKRMEG